MSLFASVDPSGKYLEFAREFYSGKGQDKNFLFVHGLAASGKTTLFRSIQENFSKRVITVILSDMNNEMIVPADVFLVRIIGEYFIDDYVDQINRLAAKYPQVGFIIEWLEPPPNGLNCNVVHCPNQFGPRAGFKLHDHLADVKNAIIN